MNNLTKTVFASAIAITVFSPVPQSQTFQVPAFMCEGVSPSECSKRQQAYQHNTAAFAELIQQSERRRASTDCLEREMYTIEAMTNTIEKDNRSNEAWDARDRQIREIGHRCATEDTLKANMERADRILLSQLREMNASTSTEAFKTTMDGITNRMKAQNDRRSRALTGGYVKASKELQELEKQACRKLLGLP